MTGLFDGLPDQRSVVEMPLVEQPKNYLEYGPQAALRAITPTGDFYVTSSRDEPAVDPGHKGSIED